MPLPTVDQIREAQARHPEITLMRGTFGIITTNGKCCCPLALLALDAGVAHFEPAALGVGDYTHTLGWLCYGEGQQRFQDSSPTLRELLDVTDAEIVGFARGVDGEPCNYLDNKYEGMPDYYVAYSYGKWVGSELFGPVIDYDTVT